MCPTEILYDDIEDSSYIRLLPIETRLRDESLSELRNSPEEWIEYPLDLTDAEALRESLGELANTRHVTPEEAAHYGLLSEHFSLSLIHISEPTRQDTRSRIPSSA